MRTLARVFLAALLLSVAGCRCTVDGPMDAGPDSGPGGSGGTGGTAGGGGGGSAGTGGTGGATDSGVDAGTDAGVDAGPVDAGIDAGPADAGVDAGPVDAGVDAGPVDAGVDAGPIDAGVDAGMADAGILGDVVGTVLSHGDCQIAPVPDATVTLRAVSGAARTTTTDINGRFRFASVPAGPAQVAVQPRRVLADFRPLLGSHQLPLDVRANQSNALTFYLAPGCGGRLTLGSVGLQFVQLNSAPCPDGLDVTVEVEPGDLVAADGGVFIGDVFAFVAAPVPGKTDDGGFEYSSILTMPGNMSASADGGSFMLDTFGALELSLYDDVTGEPLNITPGQRLRVYHQGLSFPSPASVPAYFFDTQLGQWLQEGNVTATDGGWAFDLAHLSWWNPDVPVANLSCVRGRVRRNGVPVPGASVVVYSQTGGGQALSLSAEGDGTFCTNARPGMSLWYQARVMTPGVAPVLDSIASGFLADTADGGRTCGSARSACVDVGDIDVVDVPGVCITGRGPFTNFDDGGFGNSPDPLLLSGEVPPSAFGGRPVRCGRTVPLVGVQPNASGEFCASVPANGEYSTYTGFFGGCPSPLFVVDGGVGQRCGGDGGCVDVGTLSFGCLEARGRAR